MSELFDARKFLEEVFAPQPGETVAILVDLPHGSIKDHQDWIDRRQMAEEWHQAMTSFPVKVLPLATFQSTGANNGALPEICVIEGSEHSLKELIEKSNILIAMTEYSATAPLSMHVKNRTNLRVASMPRVLKRMEKTALSANYPEVGRKVHLIASEFTQADYADVVFSTGDEFRFDLRFRRGMTDDGSCRPDSVHPLINLPSGEAFIVPYEGEQEGVESQTAGILPVKKEGVLIHLHVKANKIESVTGDSEQAKLFEAMLNQSEARRNIAELGMGCNDKAIITGNVLEDEKAGFHWAFGRSEHLGGTVGPDAFDRPDLVLHQDIVYAPGCPIEAKTLHLSGPNGYSLRLIEDTELILPS